MVLVERNNENVRNGRRSRGPSPNGHGGTPDTSSDDENSSKKIGGGSTKSTKNTKTSEYEAEKIRVGRDYQALCPDLVPTPERKPELISDRALLVWSPTKDIPDTKLEEYISVAKEKYGYNGEQALGMLFWHKHDLERAVLDLANFTPFPDEWTVEDKVLFEQAFQFHGKSFHRIRQMLPDKTIASLVKYYYSWKKTRSRTSVMDRQEKMKKNDGSENGSENGSNEESDNEEKKWPIHRGIRRVSGSPPPRGISIDDSHHQTASSTSNSTTNSSSLTTTTTTTATSKTLETTLNQASTSSAAGVGASVTSATTSGVSSVSTSITTTGSGNLNVNGQQNDVNDNTHSRTYNIHGNNNNNASSIGNTNNNNNLYYGNSSTTKQLSINNNHLTGSTTTTSNDLQQSSSSCGTLCCTGCGVPCNVVNTTIQGKLCNSCYHHWRRTGTMRPTSGPACIGGNKRSRLTSANNNTNYNNNQQQLNQQLNDRHKRKPPRGMHINHDDIVALASTTLLNNNNCTKINSTVPNNNGQDGGGKNKQLINRNDELLANMDREIVSLRSQIQHNKQIVSTLKRKNSDSSEDLRTNDASSTINRINSRWNSEELLLAVEGVKKYGKDFQAIAEVIGTKTEAQVRTFFVNYRRRYNLDNVLKEYEAENAQREQQNNAKSTTPTLSKPLPTDATITTTTSTSSPETQSTISITAAIIDDEEENNAATTENNINNTSSSAVKLIDDDVMEVDEAEETKVTPEQSSKETPKVDDVENGVAVDKIDVDEEQVVDQEQHNESENELVINESSIKEEDKLDEIGSKLNDKTLLNNISKDDDMIIDSSLIAATTPTTTLTEITSE